MPTREPLEPRDPERVAPGDRVAPRPLTVAELDRRLRGALEGTGRHVVTGEVRDPREASSGHVYLTLRDEEEDAAVDCVVYRMALSPRSRALLTEGARVVVVGRATIYAARGRLQFSVDEVRPLGRGALLEAREKLLAKLSAEGLFSPQRKRRLPKEPRVVGVVTSGDGAAIHDILTCAFRRSRVHVVLARAPVQGPAAATRIGRALVALAQHPDVEVILLARGGGSKDDLAVFDDEALARLVAACRVPVVSAIGHETDTTILDLVADARAATPSQAAELVTADDAARRQVLAQLVARLARAVRVGNTERRRRLERGRARLDRPEIVLGRRRRDLAALDKRLGDLHPRAVVAATRAEVTALEARLAASITGRLVGARAALEGGAARLDAMSPLRVLGRGYAIATDERGLAVRDAAEIQVGERLDVRFAKGALVARVESVRGDDEA